MNRNLITFTAKPPHEQAPVTGLLVEYINSKAAAYVEPTRKGTPKGEKIGFSRAKHFGTLLALTSIPVNQQAEAVGTSHGLFRVWRTEEQFWNITARHIEEFRRIFWDEIAERVQEKQKLTAERNKLPLEKYTATKPPELPVDRSRFGDVGLYGPILVDALFQGPPELGKLQALLSKPKSPQRSQQLITVIEGWRFLRILQGLPPVSKKTQAEASATALRVLREILTRKRITAEDQKAALDWLGILEANEELKNKETKD